MTYRKKLIEVALPLDDINVASAREKSIRHGHPSTLHLWWARRPLAAARAVIFAQMVDDPSTYVDVLLTNATLKRKAEGQLKKKLKVWEEIKKNHELAIEAGVSAPEPGLKPNLDEILAELERERLFDIIRDLVKWENTTNEKVLQAARNEIWQSWRRACADNADHPRADELFNRDKLPAFHDPFAGGGSLPLEAQRLGLEAYASDLNPVAVLINKAMIEIPPKFADMPPVNPEVRENKVLFEREWKGAEGLAEDVRYYGQWMRDEAEKRIGHLYPKVKVTEEMITDPDNPRPDLKQYLGRELSVIAWIWARTVKSPNPAFAHVDVPLISSFSLYAKKGKEVWIDTVKHTGTSKYEFKIKVGSKITAKGTISKSGGTCLISGSPITFKYIRSEAKAGRMSERLIAIVAYDGSNKVFLNPLESQNNFVKSINKIMEIGGDIPKQALGIRVQLYGINDYSMLFNNRQFKFLYTLCDIVRKLGIELSINPDFDKDYIKAIQTYLALSIGRYSDYGSTMTYWDDRSPSIQKTFGLPTLQMRWSYPETNPFENFSGGIDRIINNSIEIIKRLPGNFKGIALQEDAIITEHESQRIISTDPPYYDNIGYAALSDYFYIWLKFTLQEVFTELFSTILTPKENELIAEPGRHNNKQAASKYFENSFNAFLKRLYTYAHPAFPITIYYAFKQSELETDSGKIVSTGWEVFLEGLVEQKWHIVGTWPIRTEQKGGLRVIGRNSLASSIVLVCNKRLADAPTTTRRAFINTLREELPVALAYLQRCNIAPVDLAQAAIGPGMSIYTRYSKVLDAEGKEVTVREALALINQTLDEVLAKQEGDFDSDTRWALAWFDQYGFREGEYGVAETLSKAKNTSVSGLVDAGVLFSKAGKVRLLKPDELNPDWDPATDKRLTVWEMVHQLIRTLDRGEENASELLLKLSSRGDSARELAYRLYSVCERKKWAQEALAYNSLIQSWSEIESLARKIDQDDGIQQSMFGEE